MEFPKPVDTRHQNNNNNNSYILNRNLFRENEPIQNNLDRNIIQERIFFQNPIIDPPPNYFPNQFENLTFMMPPQMTHKTARNVVNDPIMAMNQERYNRDFQNKYMGFGLKGEDTRQEKPSMEWDVKRGIPRSVPIPGKNM